MKTIYHGTNSTESFDDLKPSGVSDVIWFTDDRDAAMTYAKKYYKKGESRIFEAQIKPSAKILDIRDISIPLVKEIRDQESMRRGMGMDFRIPDEQWEKSAGFHLFENPSSSLAEWLKEEGIDIAIVKDHTDGYHGDHLSYAVINPQAIEMKQVVKAASMPSLWYHLTDTAKFKLKKGYTPEDNATGIEDRSGQSGIYLTPDVETWVNGHGYWRPFVAEFKVDPSVKQDPGVHGRYGGEMFVPEASYPKLQLQRVIPLDAYAREHFGSHGWIEDSLGVEFDTGNPIDPKDLYSFRGYKYDGPDVREMPSEKVRQLKKDLKKVKGTTDPRGREFKEAADMLAKKYRIEFEFTIDGDEEATIDRLKALEVGQGRDFMREFVKLADQFPEIRVYLNAKPLKDTTWMTQDQLVQWYKSFGFKQTGVDEDSGAVIMRRQSKVAAQKTEAGSDDPRFRWKKENNQDGFEINVYDVNDESGKEIGTISVTQEFLEDDENPFFLTPYEGQDFHADMAQHEYITDIRALSVDPKYQGQGVAKYIYNLALKEIKKRFPDDPIFINASPMGSAKHGDGMDLNDLVKFYQKAGFKVLKQYDEHKNATLWLDDPAKIKLVAAEENKTDWAITVPKTIPWEDYEKELQAVENGLHEMLFKVPPHFKAAKAGDRCFVVHDGEVKGWMEVTGLEKRDEPWTCETTGREWAPGTYLKRSGEFHPVQEKTPMQGFQGIRRYQAEASIETESSFKLETKVSADYKTAELYRGIQGTNYHDIDPLYEGSGVFGRGTYYAMDTEIARSYMNDDVYNWMLKYEFKFQNPLVINSPEDVDLDAPRHGMQEIHSKDLLEKFSTDVSDELDTSDLSMYAGELGHDAIFMKGAVDGGEQVLIPNKASPGYTLKAASLFLDDQAAIKDLESIIGMAAKQDKAFGHGYFFPSVPLDKMDDVQEFLDTLEDDYRATGSKETESGITDTDFPYYHVSDHPETPSVPEKTASKAGGRRGKAEPMGLFLFIKGETVATEGFGRRKYRWDAKIKPGTKIVNCWEVPSKYINFESFMANDKSVVEDYDRALDSFKSWCDHEDAPRNEESFWKWIEDEGMKWEALVCSVGNSAKLTEILKQEGIQAIRDEQGYHFFYGEPQLCVIDLSCIEWGPREENVQDGKVYQLSSSLQTLKYDFEGVATDDGMGGWVESSLEDWSGEWVHYSKIPEVKINPKQYHQDPAGVYLFPKEFKTEGNWTVAFPHKFEVSLTPGAKVLDLSKLTRSDMEQMFHQMSGYSLSDYTNWEGLEEGNLSVDSWWDAMKNFFILKGNGFGPGAWNKAFRNLGYDALFDDTASIHGAEVQLVVLNPKAIGKTKMIDDVPSIFETIEAVTLELQKLMSQFGDVKVEAPRNVKDWSDRTIKSFINVTSGDRLARWSISPYTFKGDANPRDVSVRLVRDSAGLTRQMSQGVTLPFATWKDAWPKAVRSLEDVMDKIFGTSSEVSASTNAKNLQEGWDQYCEKFAAGDYTGYRKPDDKAFKELQDRYEWPKSQLVFRAIRAESIDTIRFDELGVYWTNNIDMASPYYGDKDLDNFKIHAKVLREEEVDWLGTIEANQKVVYGHEEEVTLLEGCELEILKVEVYDYEKDDGSYKDVEAPKKALAQKGTDVDFKRIAQWYMDNVFKDPDMVMPDFKITNSPSASWLGQAEMNWQWEKPVVKLQKRILGDEKTLDRILAHEMIHVWQYMCSPEMQEYYKIARENKGSITRGLALKVKNLKEKGSSHGQNFHQWADKINAIKGPGYVTETEGEGYVKDALPEFFVFLEKNKDGKVMYSYFRRASPQIREEMQRRRERSPDHEFKLVKTNNPDFQNGDTLGKFGKGRYAKIDQTSSKELWETGKETTAATGWDQLDPLYDGHPMDNGWQDTGTISHPPGPWPQVPLMKQVRAALQFKTQPTQWNGNSRLDRGIFVDGKIYTLNNDLESWVQQYVNIPEPELKEDLDEGGLVTDSTEFFRIYKPIVVDQLEFTTYDMKDPETFQDFVLKVMLKRNPVPKDFLVHTLQPEKSKKVLVQDFIKKGKLSLNNMSVEAARVQKQDLVDAWALIEMAANPWFGEPGPEAEAWRAKYHPKFLQAIKATRPEIYQIDKIAKKWRVYDNGRRIEGKHLKNPVIIVNNTAVDGNHRLITMAETGVKSVQAIVLNLPWAKDLDATDAVPLFEFMPKVTGASDKVSESEFLDAINLVADESNFAFPEYAYWQCTDFSTAIFQIGKLLGIPVEIWGAEVPFKEDNREVKKGETVGHTFVKVGNTYYDWTGRQADPDCEFPIESKKPIYPGSKRSTKYEGYLTEWEGPEHYVKLLWEAIDKDTPPPTLDPRKKTEGATELDDETLKQLILWAHGETKEADLASREIPAKYRQAPTEPLYRGLGLQEAEYKAFMKNGFKSFFKGQAVRIESWTTDFHTARNFAHDSDGDRSIVLIYQPQASEVLVDLASVFSDDEIVERARVLDPDRMRYIASLEEGEVILKLTPKTKIGPKNIDWELQHQVESKLDVPFHTVMVNAQDCVPKDVVEQFMAVQGMIPQDAVFEKHPYQTDFPDGREQEPHVTVLYGLKEDSSMGPIAEHVSKLPPVKFTIGEISAFRNDDKPYDVLKLAIITPDIEKLHYWIRDNFENACTFEFSGHMTLSYIKKGTCQDLEGPCEWTGKEYECGNLVFSHRTDGMKPMPMKKVDQDV